MSPVTVLITGAGTANHHCVVRGLRQEREIPLRILSCDMDDDNAGRYLTDGFVRVPPAVNEGFAEAMLDVCRRHAVDLLIPIVEYELPRLAAIAEHLSALGCRLARSPAAAVDTCLDKFETFRFLVERGLPTPHTWLPEQLPAALPFPLFLKPRRFGRSSIGCHWVKDDAELSYHLARASDPIVQPALTGRLRSVDMLSDFEGNVFNIPQLLRWAGPSRRVPSNTRRRPFACFASGRRCSPTSRDAPSNRDARDRAAQACARGSVVPSVGRCGHS